MIEKILSLMSRSEVHKYYTVEDIGRLIIPAIIHNKIRFYVDNGKVVGFVTYAFLSGEVEESYENGTKHLLPSAFEGEEGTIWFIDFVAPYGHCKPFIRELKKEFGHFKKGKTKRIKPNKSDKIIPVYGR